MIYHVLPGDSLTEEFNKTGIEGQTIVCRECLIVGPIDADPADEFWSERSKFILSEYGEDEIEFQERVADELEKLSEARPGDEVNLWFEYELFCQVNMWFCISKLSDSCADVYRVAPVVIDSKDRWKGFGPLKADDLKTCFDARIKLSDDDISLGRQLWESYRRRDSDRLIELSRSSSPAFPYLEETARAAAEADTAPQQVLSGIRSDGKSEFDEVFAEFSRRAGVYGFGDLQVSRMLDRIDT